MDARFTQIRLNCLVSYLIWPPFTVSNHIFSLGKGSAANGDSESDDGEVDGDEEDDDDDDIEAQILSRSTNNTSQGELPSPSVPI